MSAMGLMNGLRRWASRAMGTAATAPVAGARLNWEGVYPHFGDVPAKGPGFDDDAWADDTRRLTEHTLAECAGTGKLPPVIGDNALLPLLAVAAGNAGRLKVLDFGGGAGISFVHLVATLSRPERIEYHIVESRRLCEQGAHLFAGDARIRFHSSLPSALPELDIVYINSAMQYVEDYRALLEALCRLSPRFILLARCSAGVTPTFATAQTNHPGSRIPCWFVNVREIESVLERSGYSLKFMARSSYQFDLSNFPEEYRLSSACNLIFARGSTP